jgi:DNA-binding CsgD family transcriptional regulator
MKASRRDEQALLEETVRAAAEALRLEDLGPEALEPLLCALGASGALLYRFDTQGRPEGVAGNLVEAASTYTPELFAEDPVQRQLRRYNDSAGRVLIATQELDRHEYHRSAAYRDFYWPFDMEHLLGGALSGAGYGTPGMTGILITRSRGGPDFSVHEQRLLEAVQPHLAALARRSERLAEEAQARRGMEAVLLHHLSRPHLVLDTMGRLLWASVPARELLALLPGARVPEELVEGARRLAALVQGGSPSHALAYTFRFTLEDGRALRAELAALRMPDGELSMDVELEASGLGALQVAQARERWGLTRAEGEVLGLLVTGLSNPDMARRLCVSVETVRTHVQRILGKLGVATRQEVAERVHSALIGDASLLTERRVAG